MSTICSQVLACIFSLVDDTKLITKVSFRQNISGLYVFCSVFFLKTILFNLVQIIVRELEANLKNLVMGKVCV